MNQTTVVVIEDHPIIIAGIEFMLEQQPHFTITGKANDFHQVITCITLLKPQIAILDLNLNGVSGLELIKRIQRCSKSTRILVFSSCDELTFGVRSIKAGALGYLMKNQGLDELLNALSRVKAGKIYLSAALKNYLLEQANSESKSQETEADAQIKQLSDRELQVMQCIGKGYATATIAGTLHLSPKTISSHKEHLKVKLDINTSSELLRLAIKLAGQNKI